MPTDRNSRQGQHRTTPYARPPPTPPPAQASLPMTTHNSHALDSDRSPLPTDARQLTRMVAMFWNPRAVLNAGAELQRAIDDDSEESIRATASKSKQLEFELYDELDRLQPDLFDLLSTAKDNHFMRNVREKLNEGRSGAKAEDNNKVKNSIVHWRQWSPPLVNEPKSNRGTLHPECAWYLSPITVNWDNDEERRQFVECGNPPMLACHWPRLVYPEGKGDPKRPSEGLLQGDLCVKAAQAILKSPSSVLPSTSARPGVAKRGRKGIASKYHLSKITPAFLAYVAVVVRFALSSEETFNDDGGTFNYIDFYTQLREYLEAPKFRRRADALIAWWNKTLFPNAIQELSLDGSSRLGMLALLDAEVEEDEEMDDTSE